nr:DUF2608 domain-containing protein [Sansalvadorimonas sp. 2012CJ34-2]
MTKGDSESTREKLAAGKIPEELFHDIEIVQGQDNNKGDRLAQYLERKGFNPDQVYFVDDMEGFCEQVEDCYRDRGIACQTFVFTGALPMAFRCNAQAMGTSIASLVGQHNALHQAANERIGKRFT